MWRAAAIACTAVLVWLGLGLMRPSVAHAGDDDFFGSSPGPLSASHGSLDSAQHCNDCHINNGKELSNDKCLGCHDHQNLAARINAGKGFHSSAKVRGKKCESCHHEHKGKGYDLMGWSSLQGGQTAFDHELTGWPLKGKHAKTDCKDCHKASDHQGLTKFMGTDRLCGSCHNEKSAAQVRAQGHARVRALPRRERVEAREVVARLQPRRSQGRVDAAARQPRRRRVHQVPPQGRVQPAGGQARRVRQRRLSRQRARRPSVRLEGVRALPLGDVQDVQAAELRSHRRDPLRSRSRPLEDQVLRLPHQGARRDQAERRVRSRRLSREGQQARRSVQGVRQPAEVRHVPSVGWSEVHAERVQSFAHEISADVQARDGQLSRVSPRHRARRLRELQRRHRVHGLPRAQDRALRSAASEGQVQEQ